MHGALIGTFPPTTSSLFWNALGKLGPVVCGDGHAQCEATSGGRTAIMGMDVPSSWFVLDRAKYAGAHRYFQGTLTIDKQDASGVVFGRNRYYDPSTGRFTQEDPIGLAGGLNLYGFAAGDPVNLSDPFGLCPVPQLCAAALGAAIGAGGRLIFNAVTDRPLGEGVLESAAAGAIAGATFGLAAPEATAAFFGRAAVQVAIDAAPVAAAAGKTIPFKDFPSWGREIVGWGSKAEGAFERMHEMTTSEALAINPEKVKIARAFYSKVFLDNPNNNAAAARVQLMDRIAELQRAAPK
jgi:RHS repeat-associated protein